MQRKRLVTVGMALMLVLSLAFVWASWRPAKHPTETGTAVEAWDFASEYLAQRCEFTDHSTKYDDSDRVWVFEGQYLTRGNRRGAEYACRVYFGKDGTWHVESCRFYAPKVF